MATHPSAAALCLVLAALLRSTKKGRRWTKYCNWVFCRAHEFLDSASGRMAVAGVATGATKDVTEAHAIMDRLCAGCRKCEEHGIMLPPQSSRMTGSGAP